ncbi:SRPBCC family protein [Flavobacterium cucumis]|uniref:Ligand-binding SRPBCC domain-containing protein n=1 Tax=Flavobacterium cucumis TaxID=416016 RepID=A0A1M7ZWY3_9FLAO|nr:SRPBCC family protein [Flavobacterium cucumis]SHO73386.1 Ligand-binding SRPBCC domain-containing protein [Flavobacterium cucumis]
MTQIKITTKIKAPIEIVFDNCRNIDIHQYSASKTNEKAIAGRTSGLINKGETVTWKGKHFGINLNHQSMITKMDFPNYFVDEQLKGHFKNFKHQHFFTQKENQTIMTDILDYETPFGFVGKLFDKLLLKNHLIKFIIYRNAILKELSENHQNQPPQNRNAF